MRDLLKSLKNHRFSIILMVWELACWEEKFVGNWYKNDVECRPSFWIDFEQIFDRFLIDFWSVLGSKIRPKSIPKRYQNKIQASEPKLFKNNIKWFQKLTQMVPKWCPNAPRMVAKRLGQRKTPRTTSDCFWIEFWSQTCSKLVPKFSKI